MLIWKNEACFSERLNKTSLLHFSRNIKIRRAFDKIRCPCFQVMQPRFLLCCPRLQVVQPCFKLLHFARLLMLLNMSGATMTAFLNTDASISPFSAHASCALKVPKQLLHTMSQSERKTRNSLALVRNFSTRTRSLHPDSVCNCPGLAGQPNKQQYLKYETVS